MRPGPVIPIPARTPTAYNRCPCVLSLCSRNPNLPLFPIPCERVSFGLEALNSSSAQDERKKTESEREHGGWVLFADIDPRRVRTAHEHTARSIVAISIRTSEKGHTVQPNDKRSLLHVFVDRINCTCFERLSKLVVTSERCE